MAIPYHTHRFTIPAASRDDVKDGTRTDVALVPASVGSAASKEETDFATAEQGEKADTALQPGDIGSDITGPITQFVDNGFPNHQTGKSYNQGSYVRYVTGGGARIYRSKVANNTALPTDANSWEPIGDLAFVNPTGTPSNQTFLRGDYQWSQSSSLIYGPDNFVTTSGGSFPDSGLHVVYAMNGPNTNEPDARYWYELGDMAAVNRIADGWGTNASVSNRVYTISLDNGVRTSLGRADRAVQYSEAKALAFKDKAGREDLDTTNSPGTVGYLYNNGGYIYWQQVPTPPSSSGRWVDNPVGNIYQDENLLINNRGTERGCDFYRDGAGINITTGNDINVLSTVRDARITGCFCIHFFNVSRHYMVMGTGIYITTNGSSLVQPG